MEKDGDVIDFVACPNHDTNVGWNKLRVISSQKVKCDLCQKEFTLEEIKEEIRRDYQYRLQDLQRGYHASLAFLQQMAERVKQTH